MDKITPETAPVGARLLIKRAYVFSEPFEVIVLEWAPSGRFVKLRYVAGSETWSGSVLEDCRIVEALPPKVESEDDSIKRIYERYGNDLAAFFEDAQRAYLQRKPLAAYSASATDRSALKRACDELDKAESITD